ncbi:MAG: nicotinate-nicotinamide nucleotide adenylyltransferase, partial [Proteobacteria bacterium]|nr:nicotinate-nicotinamide nucleotide adenylyltransferase [Pseudomonadota bacterium]
MMVTAVFGGTFDPVHLGHLKLAHEIFLKLDATVVLVPCRIPPHRPQPVASAEQRLAMLQLAIADEAHVIVDDCELHRDGPSFTMDTLRAYRAR